MAEVLIINAAGASEDNVNAAGDDIPAYGFGKNGDGTAVVLTAAELDTLLSNAANVVAVLPAALTQEQRRLISKVLRLGKNPGA